MDTWRDAACEVRVRVTTWHELAPVEGQYIERPRNLRMVWAYVRRVGLPAVVRKIRSRLAESARNRKVAGFGVGRVVDAPAGCGIAPGSSVAFFAPNVSASPRRVVCDRRLVVPLSSVPAAEERGTPGSAECPESLRPYIGWSPYSGIPVNEDVVANALLRLASSLGGQAAADADGAMPEDVDPVVTHRPCPKRGRSERPTAVLFGLGNYAKTQVVPPVRQWLDLRCVHEIDPDQIAAAADWPVALDTAPWPADDEDYDAWFIAGFHHTHAPIARHALSRGRYAVCEKPLATTSQQLDALEEALSRPGAGALIGCFQRRYSPMNDWAREDLAQAQGSPIHYHCIVYEIPIPPRHWYNWPNSRSRLTSNGCHWLDHFLHLNGYATPVDHSVNPLVNGDVSVTVTLANKAVFTMLITEHGSERLGVRDHVELRAGDVTVTMTDQAFYRAESSRRVLRRRSVNPMRVYRRMYESIARIICEGGGGDAASTLVSTRLTLALEEELARMSGQEDTGPAWRTGNHDSKGT